MKKILMYLKIATASVLLIKVIYELITAIC
jgi:hypothetical protein